MQNSECRNEGKAFHRKGAEEKRRILDRINRINKMEEGGGFEQKETKGAKGSRKKGEEIYPRKNTKGHEKRRKEEKEFLDRINRRNRIRKKRKSFGRRGSLEIREELLAHSAVQQNARRKGRVKGFAMGSKWRLKTRIARGRARANLWPT